MALVKAHLETTAEALAAATAETVLQLVAPANQALRIIGWGVAFNGAAVDAVPVTVQLAYNTTTGTRSSKTAHITNGAAETLQATGFDTFTVEPTLGDVLATRYVHPQVSYEKEFALGEEPHVRGAERIGITCTAPATVSVTAWIDYEE